MLSQLEGSQEFIRILLWIVQPALQAIGLFMRANVMSCSESSPTLLSYCGCPFSECYR